MEERKLVGGGGEDGFGDGGSHELGGGSSNSRSGSSRSRFGSSEVLDDFSVEGLVSKEREVDGEAIDGQREETEKREGE